MMTLQRMRKPVFVALNYLCQIIAPDAVLDEPTRDSPDPPPLSPLSQAETASLSSQIEIVLQDHRVDPSLLHPRASKPVRRNVQSKTDDVDVQSLRDDLRSLLDSDLDDDQLCPSPHEGSNGKSKGCQYIQTVKNHSSHSPQAASSSVCGASSLAYIEIPVRHDFDQSHYPYNTHSTKRGPNRSKSGKEKRASQVKRKSISGDQATVRQGRSPLRHSNTDPSTSLKKRKVSKGPVKRTNSPCAHLHDGIGLQSYTSFSESLNGIPTLVSRMMPVASPTTAAISTDTASASRLKTIERDVWVRGAADESASESELADDGVPVGYPAPIDSYWPQTQTRFPSSGPVVHERNENARRPKMFAEVELERFAGSSAASDSVSSPTSIDDHGSRTESTPADTEDMESTPALDLGSFAQILSNYSIDVPPDSIRELAIAALTASKASEDQYAHTTNHDETHTHCNPALIGNEAVVRPFKYLPTSGWPNDETTRPVPATPDAATAAIAMAVAEAAREHHENVAEALAAFVHMSDE